MHQFNEVEKVFRGCLIIMLLIIKIEMRYFKEFDKLRPHFALIRFDDIIQAKSAEAFLKKIQQIEKFKKNVKGIAFAVNSRGGSLVHSQRICDYIQGFSDKNKLKVVTFAESYAASGGYYLLTAGEKIYVKEESVIGSIGVISTRMNFHNQLSRLGVDRVYLSSFEENNNNYTDLYKSISVFNKASESEKQEAVGKLKETLFDLHQIFIERVKKSRSIAPEDQKSVFNAGVYLGKESVKLNLADNTYHNLTDETINTVFKSLISTTDKSKTLPVHNYTGLSNIELAFKL